MANKSKLTENQEALAKAYILHHGNQSDAYREVYPDSKAAPASLWVLASKAYAPDKVQLRITELQDMATERHLITVASLTDELDENRGVAKAEGQAAAMTASTVAKAKLHGHMMEKVKHSGAVGLIDLTNKTDDELQAILNGS